MPISAKYKVTAPDQMSASITFDASVGDFRKAVESVKAILPADNIARLPGALYPFFRAMQDAVADADKVWATDAQERA